MRNVREVNWEYPGDAVPAFLTLVMIPLTYKFVSFALRLSALLETNVVSFSIALPMVLSPALVHTFCSTGFPPSLTASPVDASRVHPSQSSVSSGAHRLVGSLLRGCARWRVANGKSGVREIRTTLPHMPSTRADMVEWVSLWPLCRIPQVGTARTQGMARVWRRSMKQMDMQTRGEIARAPSAW